jgi:LysR family cys regulon transcriptional activator
MKLQQLRYLREVVKRGLNVSEAAEALYTSQPGISKQIRLLEEELGVQILVRHGKRVIDLTEPGRLIVEIADRMLQDADSLKAVGREFGNEDTGALSIATTPTQARYALPSVVQRFRAVHSRVRLNLREGSPEQIVDLVASAAVDVGIVTELYPQEQRLVLLPCWHQTEHRTDRSGRRRHQELRRARRRRRNHRENGFQPGARDRIAAARREPPFRAQHDAYRGQA